MSILIKLSLLFFLVDTFIRKPFHLEKLLDAIDKAEMLRPVLPVLEAGCHGIKYQSHTTPFFWVLILYGVALVVLSIALMIYESSKRN